MDLGIGGAAFVLLDLSTRGSSSIDGNARFMNNTAMEAGGAVCLSHYNSTNSTATIWGNASFMGNIARNSSGGAAYLGFVEVKASTAVISGSTSFMGNTARYNGGGAYLHFGNTINCSAVLGGSARFLNNSAFEYCGGGAVLDGRNSTNLFAAIDERTAYVGNAAAVGGGVCAVVDDADGVYVNVVGAVFANNAATSGGGGLVVYANTSREANVNVNSCTFSGNVVKQGPGGGLVVVAGPPTEMENNSVLVTITNTSFTNNMVTTGTGGGLHVDGTANRQQFCSGFMSLPTYLACLATAALDNVRFEGNSATLGGGMFAINTQCAIRLSNFSSNTASQAGGGAYTKGVTSMLLEDVRFSSNRCGTREPVPLRNSHLVAVTCETVQLLLIGQPCEWLFACKQQQLAVLWCGIHQSSNSHNTYTHRAQHSL
jgi:hypothetical protein